MSFSLRSMFGKEGSPPPAGSSAAFANEATLGHMPTSLFAEVPAMAGGSAPNSAGPLFRTLGEDMEGFSEPASPFAPAMAEEEALTVGDLLTHLPPELARSGAVAASEPVRIAPAILSQALSSGQLAVPLFEVFRVSPGMFQSPVSPDDPRLVSLPPEKLPALIHAAAQAPAVPPASPFHPLPAVNSPAPASPFGQSPFAAAQSAPPVTPFGSLFAEADPQPPAPIESARPTSLPPRRDPAQPPASTLPPSPFLDTPSPFLETPAAPAAPASSFGAPASPFAAAASAASESPPASPFAGFSLPAMPEAPAPAIGFSLFQEAQEAQPPPAPPATSVFGQPAATPPSPFLDTAPATAPTNKARMSGPATASVAALLQGQSADALGFDPAMVPTWITTQFHGGTIAELQDQPTPALDLGTIIDGITDIGFRNVLSSAKRDHTVPVPLDKLTPVGSPAPASSTTVQPASTTPAIANPFLTVAAAPEPPAPVANPFRIEPGNPFAQVPDAPPTAEAPAPAVTPEPTPTPAAAAPFTVVPKPPGQHFIQPKADIEGMLGTSAPSPAEPAPFAPVAAAKQAPKMIDPFAPAEPAAPATPPSGGFSSFDLLGGATAAELAPAPATPPLPEPPPAPAPAAAASPFFAPPAAAIPAIEPMETPPVPVQAAAAVPAPAPEPELTDLPEFPAALEVPVVVEKPLFTAPETPADLPFIAAPPAANLETAPKESFRSYGGLPVQDLPFEDVSAAEPEPEPEPEPPSAEPAPPVSQPPAMPAATLPPRSSAPAKSALGVSAMESTGEEQLVLRALLDSDEDLDIQRVIDLTTALPGIAACALIRNERVLASSATKSAEAKAFRGQAADVAKNLRALAPLIGINDAETFTLNTDTRLITLCFPGAVTLAVLHDREPSLGQRDKLTLIARQLERLSAHA